MRTTEFCNANVALSSGPAPRSQVGGPATAQLAWLDEFTRGAAAAGCPPDFVSSHLYPTDPWAHEQALPHGPGGRSLPRAQSRDRLCLNCSALLSPQFSPVLAVCCQGEVPGGHQKRKCLPPVRVGRAGSPDRASPAFDRPRPISRLGTSGTLSRARSRRPLPSWPVAQKHF